MVELSQEVFNMTFERTPLSSKKFIAFFFSLLVVAGILITALLTQTFGWAMVVFMSVGIFAVGFLAIGYILPQAALDKFVRGATALQGKQDGNNTNDSME